MKSLTNRHLYLCVGLRPDMTEFLPAVLRGGVDIVQLREKSAPRNAIVAGAREMRAICADFNVPFIMNDDPQLAYDVDADGVHVGQDDISVSECRRIVGDDAIVGLSTHAPDEFAAALNEPVTYRSAGPIVPTPTKLGRDATGVNYAVECQALSNEPVFVTGGVSPQTLPGLLSVGLRYFVVVRSLSDAAHPEAIARQMSTLIADAL